MNQITLVGNLTRDPEMRSTQSGVHVCHFTLAVNRRYKSVNDQRKADFFNIVAWRQTGELCQRYLSKGSKVAVRGVLQVCTYRMRDGTVRNDVEIIAEEVDFLTPARQNNVQGVNDQSNAAADTRLTEAPVFIPNYDLVLPDETSCSRYAQDEDNGLPF